ncbi:hypothetical protein FRB91_000863 [Serendipita sp. 411]|nr:hypothetical protein FRB91_000863 [Serendipita sp. 411]
MITRVTAGIMSQTPSLSPFHPIIYMANASVFHLHEHINLALSQITHSLIWVLLSLLPCFFLVLVPTLIMVYRQHHQQARFAFLDNNLIRLYFLIYDDYDDL